ncbi:metallopeptidase family protein [Chloroflexota bacterium]
MSKALANLPPEFRERLENVDVLVEDWPTSGQLAMVGLKHRKSLLGLYEGIPLTKRGRQYNMVLPDRITLFRKPIEAKCHFRREIENEIQRVVIHEIAHHFGIGDKRLGEIEKARWERDGEEI